MSAVAGIQRFTRKHPCPICGGGEDMARGKGQRCAGFLSSDGRFARCTREEHAGELSLDIDTDPPSYLHILEGDCWCGVTHGIAVVTAPKTTFVYVDEQGAPLFRTVRLDRPDGKRIWQERYEAGAWSTPLGDTRRVLYRLPEVAQAETVHVVEGEPCADALADLGFAATTSPMGAGKWRDEYAGQLGSVTSVLVWADCDAAGRDHSHDVANALASQVEDVRVVDIAPDRDDGYDIADLIAEGRRNGSTDDLRAWLEGIVAATPAYEPAKEAKKQTASAIPPESPADLISPFSLISQSVDWPKPVGEAALYGVVGDYVKLVEPHSEADPVAVLIQTLVLCGNAIGRRPYVPVEADRHHVNLAAVLIGDTSKARKGTSLGHAQRLVAQADPEWASKIVHGLSSGEGLIHAVRDERYGADDDGEPTLIDAGVTDKRLPVVEPEFVSVLKVASRDGSTLTAIVRQAWDTGDLRTLTRKDPLAATGAHVSLAGHITLEELRRYLDATEAANGFGNRILWACVRRSKSLPEGGTVPDNELRDHVNHLASALDFARRQDEVSRDDNARELWKAEYERLAQGQPGLVGALLARAEAQVLRLALLYALLDRSKQIQVEHLRAALSLWDYCETSVRHVFGDSTGNPDADQILNALRRTQHGLSKSEISNVFGRHLSAGRIGRALVTLHQGGLAYFKTEETGGRPIERWHSYAKKAKQAKKGQPS